MAYMMSEGGADWQTIRVRDLSSGKDLPDLEKWMRFSGLSWTKDSKGFFYSRFPEPPAGKVLEAALSGQALYYHRVGTPQSDDRLIYERKDMPTWFVGGFVTEEGRYLLVTIAQGSDNKNRLYAADLGDPMQPNVTAPITPVVETDDAEYSPIGNEGSVIYLRSDLDAPNRRVVAVDLKQRDKSAGRPSSPNARRPSNRPPSRAVASSPSIWSTCRAASCSSASTARLQARSSFPAPARSRESAAARIRACCSTASRRRSIRGPIFSYDLKSGANHAVRSAEAADRRQPVRNAAALRIIEGRHQGAVLHDLA